MIIMAVDYGDARTGIAVCDRTEILASPVTVIPERDPAVLARKIAALAAEHRAARIVLGLPRNMDGSEGFRAQAARAFAETLREAGAPEIVFRDERLTTVSAHQILNGTDTRGKKRKNTVDAVAAVIILQEYLDYRKLHGEA